MKTILGLLSSKSLKSGTFNYLYSMCQFELAPVHDFHGCMWLVATVRGSPALHLLLWKQILSLLNTSRKGSYWGWFFSSPFWHKEVWLFLEIILWLVFADRRYTTKPRLVLIVTMLHSLSSWSIQPEVSGVFLKPTVNPFKRQIKYFPHLMPGACIFSYTPAFLFHANTWPQLRQGFLSLLGEPWGWVTIS